MDIKDRPRKRLVRIHEVVRMTGLSRSTIYALMAKGKFPKSIEISLRCVGWDEDEIQNWLLEKLEQGRLHRLQQEKRKAARQNKPRRTL